MDAVPGDRIRYLGIFLGLLASNATILVPVPGVFLILLGGTVLNPFLVGLTGGLGGGLGEMTGYLFGRAARRVVGRQVEFLAARGLYHKYGLGIVYLFAATPLPFDLIGIICGLIKVDPKKFLLIVFLGKTTQYTVYAYSGQEAWDLVSSIWTRHLNLASISFLLLAGGFTCLVLWLWRKKVIEASAKMERNS